MEATKNKLQMAVAEKQIDQGTIESLTELGEMHMDDCKTLHSEFKPHLDRKVKAKKTDK